MTYVADVGVDRRWVNDAVGIIEADANRSPDTPLRIFPLPVSWRIDLYLKDESAQQTGSLKHRLARSMFLYGLVNGHITPASTLVEASSGSTAVSVAYLARLLDLPFIAVLPANTSVDKLDLITQHGGRCHLVDHPGEIYVEAERVAARTGGWLMDQFTNARIVSDWRGDDNIAESIFRQMTRERFPEPEWIVVGAGTGGTSATVGRHCRFRRSATRTVVVDPEGSAFFDAWHQGRRDVTGPGSRIEGIGRPRVEPSFVPAVIDAMIRVPDDMSIAAMRYLRTIGISAGASTGTNLIGALRLVADMLAAGRQGSVVTLICDGAERYRNTYGDDHWLGRQGIDITAAFEHITTFLAHGLWTGAPDRPRVAYQPLAGTAPTREHPVGATFSSPTSHCEVST